MSENETTTAVDLEVDATEDVTASIRPIQSAPLTGMEAPPNSGQGPDWRDTPYDVATKEQIETLKARFGDMAVKRLRVRGGMSLGKIWDALSK